MKFINKSIFAALAVSLAALTSCSDDNNYQPGAESAGCYFEQVPASRKLSSVETTFTVPVGRTQTADAITVPVQMTDESGLFSGAATVDFAAGQATADYVISYDPEKIVADKNYEITLALASDFQYGQTTYTFNAVIPAPWTSLGMCTYTDNIVSSLYNVGEDYTWQVEIQKNDVVEGLYRIVNPYATYPLVGKSALYTGDGNNSMEINAVDPDRVYFPLFNTGLILDPDYGQMMAVSRAALLLEKYPADEIYQAGHFGTLKDGAITFPVGDILIVEEAEYGQGWYTGNKNGTEEILMPGVTNSDYSAEIAYAGVNIDPDGNKFAIANVSLGADVNSAIVAAVQTDSPQQAMQAMLTGAADVVSISNTGKTQQVLCPFEDNGAYVMMVITEADGEYQELNYVQFEVSLGAKEWVAVGEMEILDGWLIPFLSAGGVPLNPEENIFYAPVEENVNTPGLFRIKNMYGYSLLSSYMEGVANIVVDASNPNFVKLTPQTSGVGSLFGLSGQAEVPYISNIYGYYTSVLGATDEQAQAQLKAPATFADDVISFPAGDCGKIYQSDPELGFYNAKRVGEDLVTFPAVMTVIRDNASTAAVAKRKGVASKAIRNIKVDGTPESIAAKKIFRKKVQKANLNF